MERGRYLHRGAHVLDDIRLRAMLGPYQKHLAPANVTRMVPAPSSFLLLPLFGSARLCRGARLLHVDLPSIGIDKIAAPVPIDIDSVGDAVGRDENAVGRC